MNIDGSVMQKTRFEVGGMGRSGGGREKRLKGGRGENRKKLVEHENSIGMKFALIPAGEFMMGSEDGDSDEKPVHKVKINKHWVSGIPELQ